jgi:hypothetical protein
MNAQSIVVVRKLSVSGVRVTAENYEIRLCLNIVKTAVIQEQESSTGMPEINIQRQMCGRLLGRVLFRQHRRSTIE